MTKIRRHIKKSIKKSYILAYHFYKIILFFNDLFIINTIFYIISSCGVNMTEQEKSSILQELGNYLDELKVLFNNTSDEILCRKENEETWSAKELLGHLFDVELVFNYRLKSILDKDNPNLEPFNQNIWVLEQEYNQWDKQLLIDGLTSLRRNLIFWLGRVPSNLWEKQALHKERGAVTFRSIVELLNTHYIHHYKQIKERIG